ncbi:DUF202 domain-containing protein [Pontibacter mangrovi]|uniref:DUF202 domain-containing protein n=1 Tax=Pontibacter mangrovi TaxID=2589816 RepID=A0A501VY57_9BACT|nr:DUF202 domain-containing protein [Pontibacter mangrovi]TPE42673.1 DUF202 domain-containing protein [Pontibacter mangrovi]
MEVKRPLNGSSSQKLKQELKATEKQNLEIRDSLAMERTKLANERTFMAYGRTSMAMVLAGLTFIKVFENAPLYIAIGIAFIPAGLAVAGFGYYRFSRKKREVARHTEAYTPTSHVHAAVANQKQDISDTPMHSSYDSGHGER